MGPRRLTARYAAMRHNGPITRAFANTPRASLVQLECRKVDGTLERAARGVVYGGMGAYAGAILFFVTIGIIDSFVHPQGTVMFWTGASLLDLFLFSMMGVILLGWWIVPLGVF
jgi:hypothetical protein